MAPTQQQLYQRPERTRAVEVSGNGIRSVLQNSPSSIRALQSVERTASLIRHNSVTRFVLSLLALPLLAAETKDVALSIVLGGLENRYNRTKTLQISFEETYLGAGRPKRSESGELSLRKPGKMRWEYAQPSGKLFVSDGKLIYYYNPVAKQAEKMKVKDSEDMRAPLAFLLGKLDFEKDFTDFKLKVDGDNKLLIAKPKSDKLPYKQVEFTVSPQMEIRQLIVSGQDDSMLMFRFSNERVNPVLDDNLFKFDLPAGATWLEAEAK
jgi:outer membrane lipoprotein carrier protein